MFILIKQRTISLISHYESTTLLLSANQNLLKKSILINYTKVHIEKQSGCLLLDANKHTHIYIKYILFICLRL